MHRVGKSKPSVWRWQERDLAEGVEGLLRDRPRAGGKATPGEAVKALVLAKAVAETPADATQLEGLS